MAAGSNSTQPRSKSTKATAQVTAQAAAPSVPAQAAPVSVPAQVPVQAQAATPSKVRVSRKAASTPAAATAAESATSSATAASTATAATAATAAVPVNETTTVASDLSAAGTTAPAETASVQTTLDALASQVEGLLRSFKTLSSSLRDLQKQWGREVRQMNSRKGNRAARRAARAAAEGAGAAPRRPSGFNMPTQLSDALCSFLGVPTGTKLSRAEAHKKIHAYIKANNLQVPTDKRKFNPDQKLKTILSGDVNEYNFFGFQAYVKHNFLSSASTTAATAVATA